MNPTYRAARGVVAIDTDIWLVGEAGTDEVCTESGSSPRSRPD
ncbi:hypothetical protein [Natrinema sp. 1APR25-10V2]|nr:hypothetical protein [Natrinema sp. 1APR25-10V2]